MTEGGMGLIEQELRRARWRRWRREVGLATVGDDLFAIRGMPKAAESLAARLVILPGDPESPLISFDEAFWEWFPNACPDPITGGSTDFGDKRRSISDCAVLYEPDYRDEAAPWRAFFALHRPGALDVAFSDSFGRAHDNAKSFHLIGLVGRIWAGLRSLLGLHRALEDRGTFRGDARSARYERGSTGRCRGRLARSAARRLPIRRTPALPRTERPLARRARRMAHRRGARASVSLRIMDRRSVGHEGAEISRPHRRVRGSV